MGCYMIYDVTVVPKSKHERVVQTGEAQLKVHITVAPEKGKANSAVVELLKRYFRVPKSAITIVRGETSRNKQVKIICA